MSVLSQVLASGDVEYYSQTTSLRGYRLFVIDSCIYGQENEFLPL
jgi:hypothetical protein